MSDPPRYRRVEEGRVKAGLSVQQLWLRYISLSGLADLLDVEAYLHGLSTLGAYQEDKLSHVVNERLDELHQAARLPYSFSTPCEAAVENPLDVLSELLQAARDDGPAATDERSEDAPPP